MQSQTANAFRRNRVLLAIAILLAVMAYGWWMQRGEVVATGSAVGTVAGVRATGGGAPVLAGVRLGEEGKVWVALPRRAPRPEEGERLPLVTERYADGTVRYRLDTAAWPAGESR